MVVCDLAGEKGDCRGKIQITFVSRRRYSTEIEKDTHKHTHGEREKTKEGKKETYTKKEKKMAFSPVGDPTGDGTGNSHNINNLFDFNQDNFDFNLEFEQIFFSIIPSALFIVSSIWRTLSQVRKPTVVDAPVFRIVKVVCLFLF